MCKNLIYLTLIVLAAVLVNISSADVVVHWTFDEGSGTTVFDASGNGRDGTFVGSPQWVAGKYGAALEFNGTSDYVIHNMPAAQNFDNFTVAFWVKASSLGRGNGCRLSAAIRPTAPEFRLTSTGLTQAITEPTLPAVRHQRNSVL
jgi:hypothetical protein